MTALETPQGASGPVPDVVPEAGLLAPSNTAATGAAATDLVPVSNTAATGAAATLAPSNTAATGAAATDLAGSSPDPS